jgi:glycosyltransferase involved in cell wall biosynthesis
VLLPATVIGGAETLSKTLIGGLDDVQVTVLTQQEIAATFEATAARVICFDDWGLSSPYDYGFRNALAYARMIARAVQRERPDVVLAMMHAASIFLALASLRHPLAFMRVRRVGSIHGHVGAYFRQLRRPLSTSERFAAFLMFTRLHSVALPSAGVYDDLIQWFPRARARAQVIHNGVDLERVRALSRAQQAPDKREPWVLMVARLSSQKDHQTLLRAFSAVVEHTGSRLILVGDGEQRSAIERQASELGIADKLSITGYLANPFPLIAAAEVVVLSSHYEGFGLVLVEAMALGRAVVATDCPSGPSEIIRDGIDGFLVPPGDAACLAARLSSLLQDPGLRARLGAAGMLRAEQFSQQRMLARYRQVLLR